MNAASDNEFAELEIFAAIQSWNGNQFVFELYESRGHTLPHY